MEQHLLWTAPILSQVGACRAVASLESSVSSSVSELSGLGAAVTQLLVTFKGLLARTASAGTCAGRELSEATCSSSQAEVARLVQYRSEELQPLLEAVTALTVRHNTIAAQLRDTVAAKSAEWRDSCSSRHQSQTEHSASLVAQLQTQLECFTAHAEQHITRVRTIGEHTVRHTQSVEECVDRLLALHSQQITELTQLKEGSSKQLAACKEQTAACEEEHQRALEEAARGHAQVLECVGRESSKSADHSSDAGTRHLTLADQLDTLHKQVVCSAEEVSSRSSALCGSVDTCLQRASDGMMALAEQQRQRCESLVKETSALQGEANGVTESGAASVCGTLTRQCATLIGASREAEEHGHTLRQSMATLVSEHQDALAEHDLHLQERQGELHELFNVKMAKDMPTGQTPSRQDYMFSRTLVATSPHEQLLRRFRSTHTAHYAAMQPLPQPQDNEFEGSSFSSLDISGNDPNVTDSAMCSDNEGLAGTASDCYAALADVKEAIEKSSVFVIPSAPAITVARLNSREDGSGFTSGIPAPVRSAPVSRSSSVSSLTDTKENKPLINGVSSCGKKKRELRSTSQSTTDRLAYEAVEGGNGRSRRVLAPHN